MIFNYFCSMKKAWPYILSLVVFLGACKFDKMLKSSDHQMKFDKAKEYYQDEDYTKASTLLESIQSIYRGTEKADSIIYYLGMSSYYQKDYIMGAHYFRNLSNMYSNSPFIEEADFMVGYCLYMQSPRPSLDQESTYLAIEKFSHFIRRHTKSPKVEEVKILIVELQNKLIEKSYNSARLYFDMGHYKAATVALHNSLQDFPETKYREEILLLILKSNYLFAKNSIREKQQERYQNTVEAYYSYISEFKESENADDAKKIYKEVIEQLN
jgi:outer membrane protein assembly factor BamD